MSLLSWENLLKCRSQSALSACKLYDIISYRQLVWARPVTSTGHVWLTEPCCGHPLAHTCKVDYEAPPTSGFRSLCTTPRECMKLTAEMRFLIIWLASLSVKRSFLLILSSSSPPRNSSKTRYVWACKNIITNWNNCVQIDATFWLEASIPIYLKQSLIFVTHSYYSFI